MDGKLGGMATLRARLTAPTAIVIAILATPLLAGCSVAENVVGGVVDEAGSQLEESISDQLGGAGVSTDGELPDGFPAEAIPLVGEVQGGGSAPDSAGWVVRTVLGADERFPAAQAALDEAGYASSAVDSDSDSGFGTFTLEPYTVVLTVATDADGVVSATYIVTNKK
ncbi:MAG: putative secreted protein [Microbacteriaceae bacterium]|nr:putative secreted protein [Microbacteriaceae bacterium]